MDKKVTNIEEVVYPAWQAGTLAQDMYYALKDDVSKTIKTHIPSVDEVVNPFFPGTLISILGRPQNAKTFMSMYILQENLRKLQETQAAKNEVCILITTEVSVEVAALQWMARASNVPVAKVLRGELSKEDLVALDDSVYQVMGLPLFIVGHSVQRAKDNRRTRPALSPNKLNDAMEYILNNYREPETDTFIEPKLIVTDYLQRLHNDDPRKGTVDFYSGAVDWAKDISLWAGCTHILNVQAKREVDERQIKIPMLGDGMNTSNIEQTSDLVFSVHMPKVYNLQTMPEFQSWGIPQLIVTDNLIYLTLLKQKEGVANKAWVFEGDMGRLKLDEINLSGHR